MDPLRLPRCLLPLPMLAREFHGKTHKEPGLLS